MSKKFTILVIALCLLGGFQTQALAEASAGGKCSSTGKIAVVGTARLVCAKVGKAKTWIALDSTSFKSPTITSVIIAPSATTTFYLTGQIINVLVTFDSGVIVTGSPQIFLDSDTIGKMTYAGGTGTQVLLFSYVTVAGDVDNVGFGLKANSLVLNGGTINSMNGTPATLTHLGIARSATRKLGPTAPAVTTTLTTVTTTVTTVAATTTTVATTATSVAATTTTTVASSAAPKITSIAFKEPGAKWIVGQNVQVKVIFDLPVVITGTPYISLLSDGINKV
ncbi:MAG: hypothetical protein NT119_01905, partial [Actinobacteria bacterium]|nr:hypothetical protein [Actinomycetota bacterium]